MQVHAESALSSMTEPTSISLFCQWLLAESTGQKPACTVVLHGDPATANDSLVIAITDYLNEYDDDADGLWLNATEELIHKITEDPSHLRLLGIDPALSQPANATEAVLSALSKRGHMVCLSPAHVGASREFPNTFHVGISSKPIKERCHITLDPQLIQSECLPQIIGDVFLEWMNTNQRPQPPIRKIR